MSGIGLGGGEKRNVNAALQVGTTTQTVEVTSAASIVAPVDSGEKSDTLTTKQLQNYVQVGSNAAEYIKIMPGFGIQNGTSNKSNYTRRDHRHQCQRRRRQPEPAEQRLLLQRPARQLAGYHGGRRARFRPWLQLRYSGESELRLHLQEFKVLTSNFSAEEPERPDVITSVTKAGGTRFHGIGVLLCPELRAERQRRAIQCQRPVKQPAEQILLSRAAPSAARC